MISETPATPAECSAATDPRSRYWISSGPCGPVGSRRSPGTNGSPLGPRRWDRGLLRPPFLGPPARGSGRPPGRACSPGGGIDPLPGTPTAPPFAGGIGAPLAGTATPALAGAVMPFTVMEDAPLPGSGMFRLADPGAILAGGAVAGRLGAAVFADVGFAAVFAAVFPFLAAAAALGLRAAGLCDRESFFAAGFVFF